MLFHPSNLPYWIFLGIGVLCAAIVIFAGGGEEDLDLDSDLDIDMDTDIDVGGDFSPLEVLGWLGIGKAPLILLLAIDFSFWGVLGWMLNVALGNPSGLLASAVLLGSMVVSLGAGSLISRPLGKIFASFGEDTSPDRLIGCIGTVSTSTIPKESQGAIGQVDVIDPAGNLLTISARLPDWATVIPRRGQNVIVVDRSGSGYLVIAQDSIDQERWQEL